jgi:hypothetical protein
MIKRLYHNLKKAYRTQYRGFYHRAEHLFIIDNLLVLLAVGLLIAGLFFFLKKPTLHEPVRLTFDFGEQKIVSGAPLTFTVHYRNQTKNTLTNAVLQLRPPKGFQINRDLTPISILSNNFSAAVPNIPAHTEGSIAVHGTFWGDFTTRYKFLADLSYREGLNGNITDQTASFLATIFSSVLTAELSISTTSYPNQIIPFTYTLHNHSSSTLATISLQTDWQGNTQNEKIPATVSLDPQETRSFKGSLKAPANPDTYPFTIKSSLVISPELTVQQSSLAQPITVIYPEIETKIELTTSTQAAQPGKSVPIKINWYNHSRFTLHNAFLQINTTPGIINLEALEENSSVSRIDSGTFIISQTSTPGLQTLSPQENGSVTILLPLLAHFDPHGLTSLDLSPSLVGTTSLIPGKMFTVPGQGLSLPLQTEVFLTSSAQYYTPEGDQLGRGPLPPRVGETTRYWVGVELYNSTNPLKNPHLTISLAKNAMFTGKQSSNLATGLTFSASNTVATWTGGDTLEPGVTSSWFAEVAISPTTTDAGAIIPLIENGFFTATDAVVGTVFNLSIPRLTNELGPRDRGSISGARVRN